MNKVRIKLLLLGLLITRILFSQPYLKPEVLSLDKGLLNPTITSLVTDSKGFIWTGTENGLYRYNGYQFKWVGHAPGKAGIIGSKKIIKIEKDSHNDNLWLLTENGIELYSRKTGGMTLYSNQLIHPENLPAKSFIDIHLAANQNIWAITDSRLFKIIPGSVVTSYPIPNESINIPTCLTDDNHGNLWIGTRNGMLVFNMNAEKFTELFSERRETGVLMTDNFVTNLYIDSKENLWIGTLSGLNRFDPVDITFEKLYPVKVPHRHPGNEIRCIREDNQGNLVIITADGIVGYNHLSSKFLNLGIQLPDPSYRTQLTSIVCDQQGILWIGTRRGIIKIRKAPVEIHNVTSGDASGFDLLENDITAVSEDARGMLWLGYRNAGVSVTDRSGNRSFSFRAGVNSHLSGNAIQSFYTDKLGNFYVLSPHSIDQYNSSRRQFESILASFPVPYSNVFDNLQIQAIAEDSLNNFWIGTNNGLVYIDLLNRTCKTLSCLKRGQDSLTLDVIYAMDMDPLNNLWMGTDNGLIQYNIMHNKFSRLTPYDKDLLNTGHKKVYTIAKGVEGTYWIGTSEGCYQFDILKNTFSAVLSSPDLLSAEVMSVTTDPYHSLWMTTSLGIFYYSPSTQSFRHFDFIDGLDNYGFNLNASSGNKGKIVYFGGKNGLTVIQNDSVYTTLSAPPTSITGVTLLHKGKVFSEFTEIPDTISIPFGNYAMKIEFAMTDFSRPEKNQYRYSIAQQGKEAEIIELYTSNSIVLGGLSQGNYKFSVMGSTSNGEWNSKPDELVIMVEVPIWRSRPAFTIYFTLTLALLILMFRYWARQLIRANREYKEREKIARQIMLQKEELTLKNKSITDSINYARRIQNAMLPPLKLLKSYFPQSFLFYLPKDIVSGDFYWINKLYNKIFISAVDCTGHGVPGAFMSIIGFELFRKITNIEGLTRPSDILNKLNEDFHEIFRDVENVVLRDGMDVAFCAIDINDMILEFSGAFNPLYLIRDNKITEIKGDRFAIGIDETNFKDQTFKNHMIPLQEGDLIYIFSDGFADQFGGPEGKKFKYRRFRHLLLNIHQLPMEDQRNILETSLREWKGDHEQVDDVMVMGIKVDF